MIQIVFPFQEQRISIRDVEHSGDASPRFVSCAIAFLLFIHIESYHFDTLEERGAFGNKTDLCAMRQHPDRALETRTSWAVVKLPTPQPVQRTGPRCASGRITAGKTVMAR
jgi:hypothetical protein